MPIPVTIQLDAPVFNRLEQIAATRQVSMRDLIVDHIQMSLNPEPHSRVLTRQGKPLKSADMNAWIEAARMGVTNEAIAERWGVSRQLVSRCLIERGVRRNRPRGEAS